MTKKQAANAALLYVEDDDLTRELVELALQEAGFEVVIAENGPMALALLETATAAFKGLITDVNLGVGPDGWGVARRARELFDGLAVVYVSGASNHDWSSSGVPHSVMITKPFAPAQVVVAVSSLLMKTDT